MSDAEFMKILTICYNTSNRLVETIIWILTFGNFLWQFYQEMELQSENQLKMSSALQQVKD